MLFESISHLRWIQFSIIMVILLTVLGPIEQEISENKQFTQVESNSKIANIKQTQHNLSSVQYKQPSSSIEKRQIPQKEALPTVEVVATGYFAGFESTGKRPKSKGYGITYSGVKVRRDVFSTIAADLKVFPLGTILYIEGYGYGVVADTGSAIKGNKLDLYFRTRSSVFKEWGKKKVKAVIIHRGEGKVTEKMLDQLNQAATKF